MLSIENKFRGIRPPGKNLGGRDEKLAHPQSQNLGGFAANFFRVLRARSITFVVAPYGAGRGVLVLSNSRAARI